MFKLKHLGLNINYKLYCSYLKQNYDLKSGRLKTDTYVTCEEFFKIKYNQLSGNVRHVSTAE